MPTSRYCLIFHSEIFWPFELPNHVLQAFIHPFRSLGALLAHLSRRARSREVVGRHRQHEHLLNFLQASHHLANVAHRLGPAKTLLDAFALLL